MAAVTTCTNRPLLNRPQTEQKPPRGSFSPIHIANISVRPISLRYRGIAEKALDTNPAHMAADTTPRRVRCAAGRINPTTGR